ncbi:MAG: MFS transporter [Nitrospirae bacterium]|nr:MFS transporter [Nitrospirota bacterium]
MGTRTKLIWVAILYFAEGFPFGLIIDTFPVYLRFQGISLTSIGLLSLVGLPWTLKFLWAPVVDLWGRRKTWFVGCQILISLVLLGTFYLDTSRIGPLLWLLLIIAILSATQDIAIDAYTIELLDSKEMGPANGIRVMTYRIALIGAGGLLVAMAGLAGWKAAFISAAFLLAILSFTCNKAPFVARHREQVDFAQGWKYRITEGVWHPLRSLFNKRTGFIFVMLFILIFKLGDMALGPMVKPFWVDRKFTPLQIGMIPGTIGVVSTVLGALLGGALTSRWGIFRALWILGIAQAASNLVYAAAAAMPPSEWLMYTASVVESFCGGLGTAPFLAFMMNICEKEYAATQYALLSALFGLTRSVSGAISGSATERLGYAAYFILTFFLSCPAFLLLGRIRAWTGKDRNVN